MESVHNWRSEDGVLGPGWDSLRVTKPHSCLSNVARSDTLPTSAPPAPPIPYLASLFLIDFSLIYCLSPPVEYKLHENKDFFAYIFAFVFNCCVAGTKTGTQ